MQIATSLTTIYTDRPVRSRASSLRGFFGQRNVESTLLHQHLPDGKTAYMYPRVQYRIGREFPHIFAIGDDAILAVDEATKDVKTLDLDKEQYEVNFVDSRSSDVTLCEAPEPIHYRFESPWLALSQKNYRAFESASQRERDELLRKILIGNVLSTCRSLDVIVTEQLTCKHSLYSKSVFVKGQKMLGFVGTFQFNFTIPNDFGLGHLVSIGFGKVTLNQSTATLSK